MAVTASGLFYTTFQLTLTQQLALNLESDSNFYLALFSNDITPDFSADTAYGTAPYDAYQCTGGAWGIGGKALTPVTVSNAGGAVLKWDGNDIAATGTSITDARCALIYAFPATSKNAVCLVDFQNDYSTVNGSFNIVWSTSGIFTIDLTP